LIYDNIKTLHQDVKEFRKDAETKLNNTRTIIKKEVKLRFDTLKDNVDELKTRFDKLEEKNVILQKHQFQIDKLNKDVNNLSSEFKNDIKLINKVIEIHLEKHQKEEPKQAVNRFKLVLIWSFVGLISTTFVITLVGIILSNYKNIIMFISGLF
jgi:small-conductance mechanosensitive channel